MADLTSSEKRLIAALDRIDYSIERATARLREQPDSGGEGVVAGDDSALQAALSENAFLKTELADATSAQEGRLSELTTRLSDATQEVARLSAANEALAKANRTLLSRLDSGGLQPDEARDALEAELEALRATRDAEIARLDEIMNGLDDLLGVNAVSEERG